MLQILQEIIIPPRDLPGLLEIPDAARAIVVFAHGSGSSRFSPRNLQVSRALNQAGLATLRFDLLRPDEAEDRANVFDIPLLAGRVEDAIDCLRARRDTADLLIGLFGASTGAAAALVADARRPGAVGAIVSRGGRPDLAGALLADVRAPTLLIVGSLDKEVIALNETALSKLSGVKRLEIVPGASHLFEEPGTLDAVIDLAAAWFSRFLQPHGGG